MENRINHIIARVLSGESSSDDILSLSEWLNENEKIEMNSDVSRIIGMQMSLSNIPLPLLSRPTNCNKRSMYKEGRLPGGNYGETPFH